MRARGQSLMKGAASMAAWLWNQSRRLWYRLHMAGADDPVVVAILTAPGDATQGEDV